MLLHTVLGDGTSLEDALGLFQGAARFTLKLDTKPIQTCTLPSIWGRRCNPSSYPVLSQTMHHLGTVHPSQTHLCHKPSVVKAGDWESGYIRLHPCSDNDLSMWLWEVWCRAVLRTALERVSGLGCECSHCAWSPAPLGLTQLLPFHHSNFWEVF